MNKISKPFLSLILVSIAALLVWHLEKPTQEKTGDVLNKLFLPNLNTQNVVTIQIEHLVNGVKLKKENGEWLATDMKTKLRDNIEKGTPSATEWKEDWQKIDSSKVAIALDTFQNLQSISLAGDNPTKHGYFEVNPVGRQVSLYDAAGKELAHLYLGKMGAGFAESYIRKEGENNVYMTDKFLRPLFPANAEGWKETPQK